MSSSPVEALSLSSPNHYELPDFDKTDIGVPDVGTFHPAAKDDDILSSEAEKQTITAGDASGSHVDKPCDVSNDAFVKCNESAENSEP